MTHTCETCIYFAAHPYLSPIWICRNKKNRDDEGEYMTIDEGWMDDDEGCEYWEGEK